MSRTVTAPPVARSICAHIARDGSILRAAQRETVVWLTPSLRANSEAEPREALMYSARVMPKMCADRTSRVKAFCALSAKASAAESCEYRRMPKKHPVRPYLLAWREHLDKTQEWLANELGTHHSTVLRWEKRGAGVDDQTFAAIAKAYGITVAELSAPPGEAAKARQMDRLLRAIPKMDEEGLRTLATMAERLTPR